MVTRLRNTGHTASSYSSNLSICAVAVSCSVLIPSVSKSQARLEEIPDAQYPNSRWRRLWATSSSLNHTPRPPHLQTYLSRLYEACLIPTSPFRLCYRVCLSVLPINKAWDVLGQPYRPHAEHVHSLLSWPCIFAPRPFASPTASHCLGPALGNPAVESSNASRPRSKTTPWACFWPFQKQVPEACTRTPKNPHEILLLPERCECQLTHPLRDSDCLTTQSDAVIMSAWCYHGLSLPPVYRNPPMVICPLFFLFWNHTFRPGRQMDDKSTQGSSNTAGACGEWIHLGRTSSRLCVRAFFSIPETYQRVLLCEGTCSAAQPHHPCAVFLWRPRSRTHPHLEVHIKAIIMEVLGLSPIPQPRRADATPAESGPGPRTTYLSQAPLPPLSWRRSIPSP